MRAPSGGTAIQFRGPGPGGPKPPRGQEGRSDEPRVNRRIRVREVRVILDDGTQLGILPTEEALRRAEEAGLDLVEVSPMARPPVCKIMDFGRFKYQQKRKAAEAKRNQHQIEIKEVKFRPKTDKHDFDVKMERIKRFLAEGNKCRVTIMFRGREIVHPEIGQDVLKRVAALVEDVGNLESPPRMEGRQMFMIVAPGKASNKPKPRPAEGAPPPPRSTMEELRTGPEITRAPAQLTKTPEG